MGGTGQIRSLAGPVLTTRSFRSESSLGGLVMLRHLLARSAAVVAIVGASCLGLVWSSGPAQAVGLPNWMTTGTMCDASTWAGGFKNVAPGALAGAGMVAVAPEAGVAAGSTAAATVEVTGPAVLGFLMQGCVLPGLERNIIAPWVAGQLAKSNASTPSLGGTCGTLSFYAADPQPGNQTFTLQFSIPSGQCDVLFTPYITCAGGGQRTLSGRIIDISAAPLTRTMTLPGSGDGGCDGSSGPSFSGGITAIRVVRSPYDGKAAGPDLVWSAPTPVTTATASIDCVRPDGTTYTLTNTGAPTSAATAGTAEDGVTVPMCNAGDTPTKIDVRPGGQPGWSPNLKPTPSDTTKYPLCASAGCLYSVAIDGNTCIQGDPSCANWELIRQTNPNRVTCFYGPYAVSCDLLRWMERAYDTNRKPITKVDVDGDPTTKTDAPAPALDPSANPTTPVPVPTVKTPSEACLNGAVSCVPQPEAPVNTQTENCWPSGWGAVNPANWVLQPIKCAFRWAFVPSPAALTTFTDGIKTDLATTGITDVSTAVGGVFSSVPSGGSGCMGPSFTWPQTNETYYPLAACSGVMAQAAAASYALATIVIVVSGGFAILRIVAAGLGYNVTLGSGGGGGES